MAWDQTPVIEELRPEGYLDPAGAPELLVCPSRSWLLRGEQLGWRSIVGTRGVGDRQADSQERKQMQKQVAEGP